MLRRDFLQAEIQRIAQILARVLGLKNDSNYHEAEELIENTLIQDFDLTIEDLNTVSTGDFEEILKGKAYPPEKLDLLAQLLFESVHPFEDIPETDTMLHKVLLIFRVLEEEYHIQSFDNLSKRDIIDKFLNNRQYE